MDVTTVVLSGAGHLARAFLLEFQPHNPVHAHFNHGSTILPCRYAIFSITVNVQAIPINVDIDTCDETSENVLETQMFRKAAGEVGHVFQSPIQYLIVMVYPVQKGSLR